MLSGLLSEVLMLSHCRVVKGGFLLPAAGRRFKAAAKGTQNWQHYKVVEPMEPHALHLYPRFGFLVEPHVMYVS